MSKNKKSEYFDLKGLLDNYRKHWWWFAVSAVLCVGAAYLYTRAKAPEYMVQANVIVRQDNTSQFATMSGIGDLFGTSANIDDEVFIINSHTVLRNVAKDLGINVTHYVRTGFLKKQLAYPEFPVQVSAAPGVADTLMTTLQFKITVTPKMKADITVKKSGKTITDVEDLTLPARVKTSYGVFTVSATPSFPRTSDDDLKTNIFFSGYDIAAEDLAENITSYQADRHSNMICLQLKTSNTEYGQAVLNAIINKYNELGLAESSRQGEQTAAFIDSRLAMITGDLSNAESEIQDYKQDHGIVDVGQEAAYNMQLRGTAERALVDAQTRGEIIKMTRDFLTQPQNQYELIPISTEIPSAAASIGQYNNMIVRRMDLMQNAKANNQALRQLDTQIDALRAAINTSLDRAYQTSQVAIREARAEANKALGRLGSIPAQEREFLNLKRNQEVKQQLYLFLLQRREETAMILANAIPKGRIVDDAYALSEPLGLGRKAILFIAFILGLCIPPVLLYLKKLLRTKFESRKDVEALTDVPMLGEVCRDNSGRSLVVSEHATSSTVELFRLIRSSLQFMLTGADDKVILVTSTRSGEGKSFISVNMAASLALLGKRVLLVGMDIRNPQLANYLGIPNGRGVTNYLIDPAADLNSFIVHNHQVDGLDILVAGPVPPNPGELLTSANVDRMFEQLRGEYDYVIVDSAPVGMVSDTFNLARIADATVYVCRVEFTTLRDIDYLNDIYDGKRLPKLSLVVNGTRTTSGYGYGYGQKGTHHHRH